MRYLSAALLIVIMLNGSPTFAGLTDKRLDIYWVDVEGGAATLIVTPLGESILIDAGNPGQRDPHRIFDVATKVAGLKQIDHMVTTHYHIDHFGGAAELAALMPIHNVYNNGDFASGREKPSPEYLNFKTEKRIVLNPGDEIPLQMAGITAMKPLHLKCLAARQTIIDPPAGAVENPLCIEPKHKTKDLSDNANSIVQLLSFGDFRFFDGGDLTWNVELKLVCPINLVGQIDVYQAEHHGLDQSNHPLLIASLAPTVAIINNGPKKGCEPQMFATLKSSPSVQGIYQLHRNIRPDGDKINVGAEYIANEDEKCEGNYVKLSVDPTATSYTVTVPSTKHEKTYAVRERVKAP